MTAYLPSMSKFLSLIFSFEINILKYLTIDRFVWVSIAIEKNVCSLHTDTGNGRSQSIKQSVF